MQTKKEKNRNETSRQTFIESYINDKRKNKSPIFKISPEPVVKWAGGKRGLIEQYSRYFPSNFNHYFEPFFGGGAVFFHLSSLGLIKKAKISDINSELINMYIVIRDNVEELISELKSGKYYNDKEQYYKIRAEEPNDPVLRAARLIYLNHTCFNGLYRVNKKGKFNVPYGRYPKDVKIFDENNLREVMLSLQNVEITVEDFEESVKEAQEGDFIYFDPPYAPLSKTADFTSYTKEGFGEKEQQRLAKVFRKLCEKGCYVMESNSSAPIIKELYSDFDIITVSAKRYINSDPSGRKGVDELLILSPNILKRT
ncbi:MAG: DNA adenine methylase [Candidatus Heimdallarchaeum aukensis]|uniref:site-specific DNA-methyltransferase (adenine-specific) n=1 Tax=Candidatus Heimdallarchaeum aukensis TaxID=2876573 RepID=A0A9Y1BKC8_9ARCH|nr:MAG: DNA adenine methylase [Candidatus Heimdallarchaeum aukensis]